MYYSFLEDPGDYVVYLAHKGNGQIIKSDSIISVDAITETATGMASTWELRLSGTGSLTHIFTGRPNNVIDIVEDDIENLLLERNNE